MKTDPDPLRVGVGGAEGCILGRGALCHLGLSDKEQFYCWFVFCFQIKIVLVGAQGGRLFFLSM